MWPPPPPRPARRSPCAALPGAARRPTHPAGVPQTAEATRPPSAAKPRLRRRPPCWVFLPHNPTQSDTAAPTPATTSACACLVPLKIATDVPRLLGFAIQVWTIPAQVVQIDIAISATGAIRACQEARSTVG